MTADPDAVTAPGPTTPAALRRRVDQALGRAAQARERVAAARAALRRATAAVGNATAAQELLQGVAEEVQAAAHSRIAGVVGDCLEAVWGEAAYRFGVRFVSARGKTDAVLYLERGGLELTDPVEQAGLGVADVVCFALRLVSLALARPARRRLLVLDEPLRHLSRDRVPAARDVLLGLSEELAVQVVMVTHSPELCCGKVIRLGEE